MQDFKFYLIKKFIVVMLWVFAAEYVMTTLVRMVLYPMLQRYLLANSIGVNISSVTELLEVLIFLLLELVMGIISGFLPLGAKSVFDNQVGKVESYMLVQVPALEGNQSVLGMNGFSRLIIFLFVSGSILLILLPMLLGSLYIGIAVTEQVNQLARERELEHLKEERKRNLMLSDIAHDLRTPITTVSGYAKALEDGLVTDPDQVKQYLEVMQNKSARMNELINLLFEYVKLDSQGFTLTREELDFCELLRENAALAYPEVEEAGMEFAIDIPEEEIMVNGDRIQLSRVVTNLINNAIRHNEAGTEIYIGLRQTEEEVQVVVADSGQVIEPEMAEHLFEPFAVGDQSRSSRGGSGLGLSIAQKVITMHGWQLKLQQPYKTYTKAFLITLEK